MANNGRTAHQNIQALCEGAVLVAMAQALSYLKFVELPSGGSLTLAMFPILFFAVRWGLGKGLMAGFTLGLMQLIFDGAYAWGWQCMVLDYLLAYTALGLAGIFHGKHWSIFPGTVVGCLGRFVFHFISGATLYRIVEPTEIPGLGTYSNPELFSLVYNGSYMLPNMILALGIAGLVYVPLKKYLTGNDLK